MQGPRENQWERISGLSTLAFRCFQELDQFHAVLFAFEFIIVAHSSAVRQTVCEPVSLLWRGLGISHHRLFV